MRNDCLKGKGAIVTGARRGIGKAIAMAFAAAGANLAICDISIDDGALFETAEQIKVLGVRCVVLQTDVSKKADVEKMVQAASAERSVGDKNHGVNEDGPSEKYQEQNSALPREERFSREFGSRHEQQQQQVQ